MDRLPRVTAITGCGKGKTTSGMGRVLLALCRGERVVVVQFLKGTGYTGELKAAAACWPDRLKIRQFGSGCPDADAIAAGTLTCRRCGGCFRENRRPENDYAGKAFAWAKQEAASGTWDMMLLDEISHPLNRNLLDKAAVVEWVGSVSGSLRLVLTGRGMPAELLATAEEATDCDMVKHPITRGILGRRGVEY